MAIPTLVVSDPPHDEVDLEAAAKLLELDVFAVGLKANFAAPEIMSASPGAEAAAFAYELRSTGFRVAIVPGAALSDVPWPRPVSTLKFDMSSLSAATREGGLTIPYDAEVVAVRCQTPPPRVGVATRIAPPSTGDLERAAARGHGPTIAEAIDSRHMLDLYFRAREGGAVQRATVVPDLLEVDGERLRKEIAERFPRLRLDERLVGVQPRVPYRPGTAHQGPERRRYSFGTPMLFDVLESIAPELATVPQYEFGSRLAYAMSPLRD